MLYQRCVRPRHCLAGVSERSGWRPASIHIRQISQDGLTCRYVTQDCATELRRIVRNSLVVTRPVCTPVPPAGNGSAAGDAGLAPPASALSKLATRYPAASGASLFFEFSMQTGHAEDAVSSRCMVYPSVSKVLVSIRVPFHLARPRAANETGSPAQEQPPARNAVSARISAWRESAQSGTGHQSRVPGTG